MKDLIDCLTRGWIYSSSFFFSSRSLKIAFLINGFEIVNNPVPGSIFVTDSHVGIVEWQDSKGWLISESGYDYYGDAVLFQYSIYLWGKNQETFQYPLQIYYPI